MIVVPLIEEARSGRSIPWVTLALVAVCTLVFLHNRTADLAVDEQAEAAIEEAWLYFTAHPYVKVDEDVAAMFGEDEVAMAAETYALQMRQAGSIGTLDFFIRHDQLEFDGRVERIYDKMENHSFYRLGFFPDSLRSPDVSLLSYALVHEDWLHLASNLVLLLIAGLFLEQVWGRTLFFLFVLSGAVAGAAGYALLDPAAGEALGGASGVCAALAGAFLIRFFSTPIRFHYFIIPPIGGKFTARGWIALPVYGGLYLLTDYILTQGAPGIEPVNAEFATWAHVGGLAWGGAFALVMKLLRIEERLIHPKMEQKAVTQSNPVLERALEAREAGRLEEAVELLAGEVARNPDNHDANLAYWDAANAVDRASQAADSIVSVLRDEVMANRKELAIQHWRELTQRAPDARVESAIEVRIVAFLIEQAEYDLATFSMRRILDGACGPVSAASAQKLARMGQDLDTDLALVAAKTALAATDLEPSDREDVERLIQQLEGVNEREHDEAAAEAEVEDPNGQSGPLFGSGYDFQDRTDPSPRDLDAEDEAAAQAGPEEGIDLDDSAGAGAEVDGDTLNAEPFELDDLTVPGVATYDLEADAAAAADAEGEDTLDSLTVEEPAGTTLPLAADVSGPVPELVAGDVHEAETAHEIESESGQHTIFPQAPPATQTQPEQHTLFPDVAPQPPPAPILGPDDEEIPLADASVQTVRPVSMDDTGAPDFGNTIDMAELGAETLDGIDAEGPELEPLPTPPAPPPPMPELEEPEVELPELSAPPARRPLKKMEAIPLLLGGDAITLDVGERGKAQLGLERIDAIAVGGVRGLREKPVVIVDLVTNWMGASSEPLKIVRLRSDRFDPRQLVPEEDSGFRALKTWIARLLAQAEAVPLPDADSAVGKPFQMFDDLAAYEREVLRAL